MPPTIKLWAGQLLLELFPVVEPPVKGSRLFDIIAQIRDVSCSKSFLWSMRERMKNIQKGIGQENQKGTHG